MKRFCAPLLACFTFSASPAAAADAPLALETKIPLGAVSGRIDHMAFDPLRQILFVAELGNDSLAVVDVPRRKVLRRITGLREPQGVAYFQRTDTLYVANAGDGSVLLFAGDGLEPAGRIALGEDADNIRIDPRDGLIYVGHGSGALSVIDPLRREKVREMPLAGHPEGFQLDPRSSRIFVNVPDKRQIAVLERESGLQVGTWSTAGLRSNFPMAIDPTRERVLVAFRQPERLVAFEPSTGEMIASIETCGDADDVFVDVGWSRVYVSCGAGYLDVFESTEREYRRLGRIETASGARTALFVPELGRLFLAVRARGPHAAGIWVYRPTP